MSDQFLLSGIRAGLGLLVVISIVGLFTASSVVEAFYLVAISATSLAGLRATRGF